MNYWEDNQKQEKSNSNSKIRILVGVIFGFVFVGTINFAFYTAEQSRSNPKSLLHILDNPERAQEIIEMNKIDLSRKRNTSAEDPDYWVAKTGPFHSIKISGNLNVNVTQGNEQEVLVLHKLKVSKAVNVEVKNGELILSQKNSFDPYRSHFNLDVTAPNIEQITATGSSHVTLQNINTRTLKLMALNSAIIEATGEVDHLNLTTLHSAQILATDLFATTAEVQQSSSKPVNISVVDKLDLSLLGSGDVTCFGDNPKIKKSIPGSGKFFLKPIPN